MSDKWFLCPHCGAKIIKLLPTTQATDLLLYCKRCKQQTKVNIKSQSQ